ncbi:HK97 family phage prohead protease [Methylocystis sp. H4A]|uniref:HK97 family phage prohead protease n=1 Tax=Methylocystis sp. H4A TaxID=2785788 RepID=UPI0018C21D2D|nr:HK97 family phage prohead protease [Methylocystis sp. H4A]MBG0802122.1 HK97 family phage prohead protease [Methylocystis sp. H4A]
MLFGAFEVADLEVRASRNGARTIKGRFPYKRKATLSAGGKNGRPRKEQFMPGAFDYSLNDPSAPDIHLLSGHDFAKPLARKSDGSLAFNDTREALTFRANIRPEIASTSFALDLFALILSGMATGVSPGFRVPPPDVVPNAEVVEEEAPSLGNALIRSLFAVILFELSIVVRPAYPESEATVEERNWSLTESNLVVPAKPRQFSATRWR